MSAAKTKRPRKLARKRPAATSAPAESAPRQRAMLRTCAADMTSRGGFQWPESGEVSAPDWTPEPVCGGGLHGLLDGCGDGSLLLWGEGVKWLVVEVDEWVAIDEEKVKAPRGRVVYAGDRGGAVALGIERYGWDASRCMGGTSTSGDGGTSTSGYGGTSTSGDRGTSTSGDRGTSTSGYGGTSTSGDRGTSTSGYGGTSTSGYGGTLLIRWHDGKRYRIATFYVGEDGIEENVAYRVNERGEAVRVEPAP